MGLTKNSSTVTDLRNLIAEGRRILLKKNEGNYFIKIRFNHNDIDGTKKWRIIIDDIEYYASEIMINIPCKTESEWDELNGHKHHIVTDATNEVVFEKTIAYLN